MESISDLDDPHSKLLDFLLTQENHNRESVKSKCRELGLMLDGAIEKINDWSADQIDELLIDEEDGGILIVKETKQLLESNGTIIIFLLLGMFYLYQYPLKQ